MLCKRNRAFALLLSFTAFLAFPIAASAKQKKEFEYPYDYVWNTLVRFIRVDSGFVIRDRDVDAGYVLFDYQDQGKIVPGTAEVLKVSSPSGGRIRVIFQVPSMPSYVETMLLQRLSRKLLDEYGEPAKQEKPPHDRGPLDTLPTKSKTTEAAKETEKESKPAKEKKPETEEPSTSTRR